MRVTTIKQVCVGVAIAGAVVGAGSAVGTAVANADASAADSARNEGPASPGPQSHASLGQGGGTGKLNRSSATAARGTGAAPTAAVRARTVRATAAPVAAPVAAIPRPAPPSRPVLPLLSVLPTPISAAASRATRADAVAVPFANPTPTHVLLIGTDGTNLDKILANPANTGFTDLMAQSVTGATSIVGHTTISGPSWTTILTGVWDNKSGVINNLFNPKPYDSWPTVINQIEYYKGDDVDTAVVSDWKYIYDIGESGGYPANENKYFAFNNSWADTDQQVVDYTIGLINAAAADPNESAFIFSYQVQVDEAGHAYGGGSPEYAQAVTNVSDNIAEIMAAINASGEDWTVIVTTDHGHQQSQGFGHGFQSPNETSSFIIFDIAGDDSNDGKQNLGYSNTDITPTIVSLFGLPTRTDFDGVPLQTKTSSLVTPGNLSQALLDAVHMYGYPNIGTDLALGTRTIFASIPYFLDGFVTSVADQLQGIVDQHIFLISALAGVAKAVVQITGDIGVAATQAVARVVAYLTGAGTIPPSEQPLPPPAAGSPSPVQALLLPANVVV